MTKSTLVHISFLFLLLVACERKNLDIPEDTDLPGVSLTKTNGQVDTDGTIIELPALALSITAKDDTYDVVDFVINYTINNHAENIDRVYLERETRSVTVELLSTIDFIELHDGRLSYNVEGTVNGVHPLTGNPIIIPFNETIWMDTGIKADISIFIGTPQGRISVHESSLPTEYSEVDTLIMLYTPLDAFFNYTGKIVQDDMEDSATVFSQYEKDNDGIVKIPFNVSSETKGLKIHLTTENSKGKDEVCEKIDIGTFFIEDASSLVGTVWTRIDNSNELFAFHNDGARTYVLDPQTKKITSQTRGSYTFNEGEIKWTAQDREITPYNATQIEKELTIDFCGTIDGSSLILTRKKRYEDLSNEITFKCRQQFSWDELESLKTAFYPEAVDIGMVINGKKILWASQNLGASCPESHGDYYAWGEILPYYIAKDEPSAPYADEWADGKENGYAWGSYSFGYIEPDGTSHINKYNFVDNATSFSEYGYSDDAARQNLGYPWRIPTAEEWEYLILNYDFEFIETEYPGLLITCNTGIYKGNNIFLPASSDRSGTSKANLNKPSLCYWASSVCAAKPRYSLAFKCANGKKQPEISDSSYRYVGMSIRPVMEVE